jgi:hypothetical protein
MRASRFAMAGVVAALVLGLTAPIASASNGMSVPQPAGTSRFIFEDMDAGYSNFSHITGSTYKNGPVTDFSCNSPDDPTCTALPNLMLNLIVPPCTSSSLPTDMCVKGLEIANSSGVLEPAILDHEVDTQKIAASTKAKTPAGGGTSIWKSASGNHLGGTNTYGVSVNIRYNIDFNPNTFQPGIGYVFYFNATIVPFTYKDGAYKPVAWVKDTVDPRGFIYMQNSVPGCEWTEVGKCAVRNEFQLDQKMALSLQIDSRLTGWLFGRMKDVSVGFKSITPTTNLLRVESTAIDVPTGYADLTTEQIAKDPDTQKVFSQCGALAPSCVIQRPQGDRMNWDFGGIDPTMAISSIKGKGYAAIIAPYLKTFPVRNSQWSLQGLTQSNFTQGQWKNCFGDTTKFQGIVTTNSMVYDPSPPSYADDSLTYKVAGAHIGYDQQAVFKGTYDLAIRSEAVRCLYNFTSAPIKVTVSVTSSDGTSQNVATEAVQEKDGWLTLRARNFTFSSPTIRLKLSQDAAAVVPTAAVPTAVTPVTNAPVAAAPSGVKKPIITITCAKGKTVKRVSGVAPKCPTGYVKKAS